MKELPIIFSTEMVKALLDRRKSMTRRLCKHQPKYVAAPPEMWLLPGRDKKEWIDGEEPFFDIESMMLVMTDYAPIQPGDILYVRENWKIVGWDYEERYCVIQFADGLRITADVPEESDDWFVKHVEGLIDNGYFDADDKTERMVPNDKVIPFKPSIHLPKWASRIWLKCTDTKCEQLKDISEEDAVKEGIDLSKCSGDWERPPSDVFSELWESIHGTWNPESFVFAYSFDILSTTGKPQTT
jgi:hypothetical protein